ANRELIAVMPEDQQRDGWQHHRPDTGTGGDDFERRRRCLIEAAHLTESVRGRVASAPVVVHAARPAVEIDSQLVDEYVPVEPCHRRTDRRLRGRKPCRVLTVRQQFYRLTTRDDSKIPRRRTRTAQRSAGCAVVNRRVADPRRPRVGNEVSVLDLMRLLE